MFKGIVTTNQNAKVELAKTKSLLSITKSLLHKKSHRAKFQFWLPTNLTRVQQRAVDSTEPVAIICCYGDFFINRMVLIYFLKRLQKLIASNKKSLLIVESELFSFLINEKLNSTQCTVFNLEEARKKIDSERYDEIIVYDEYDEKTLIHLKEKCYSVSLRVFDNKFMKIFPNNKVFTFDEIFLPTYEIIDFARQFTSKDSYLNDENLLEKHKKNNSGADKPSCYEISNFKQEIEIIQLIIDDNPITNIGIFLPYGNDEKNYDLSIEKYYRAISKKCICSRYYDGIKLKELYNIVITTYDEAKLINFDIVILPQFDKVKKILDGATIFNGICSAEDQLHIFQEKYDEYSDDLVIKINNLDEIHF